MKGIGNKRIWKKLVPKEYKILRISGHSCPKWETLGLIIDFSIVICSNHQHCKFSYQPLAMHCFHCPKSCEMCYSDDDKKNRSSNMRRRTVWYKVTKTEMTAIFATRVIDWNNSNFILRILNWILQPNSHTAVLTGIILCWKFTKGRNWPEERVTFISHVTKYQKCIRSDFKLFEEFSRKLYFFAGLTPLARDFGLLTWSEWCIWLPPPIAELKSSLH